MDHGAEVEVLEGEIAEVCGTLNVATGRLVSLIARVLDTQAWTGGGIHSPAQWVAWKCGVSPGRARSLVAMARRLGELPATRSAFEAGELSEDQVAVIARHSPAHNDAEVATLGRSATVAQLRRALGRYAFEEPAEPVPGEAKPDETPPEPDAPEPRRVSFGYGDDGAWRLSALLPPDQGALVERALGVARHRAFHGEADTAEAPTMVSWADALVGVAEGYLGAQAAARPYCDRHLVVIHVGADTGRASAHLHLGPALPEALRRLMTCDARGRVQLDSAATPLSVGRSTRIVADRTRVAVEERDGACRVPGCEATKWLQVHHIVHWEDGGATDTANLTALCAHHHRLHHRGRLGIAGNADEPDGVVFTDARGRRLAACGSPSPPAELATVGHWVHPTGERLDGRWVQFSPPPPPPPPPPPAPPRSPDGADRAYAAFIDLDDPIYGVVDEEEPAWSG